MMRVLVAFVSIALVVVIAKPTEDDGLSEEVDAYLSGVAKRSLDSRAVKLCDGEPCCNVTVCPRGHCIDDQGPRADNLAHLYGWVCKGSMCGTRAGQFAGINCDVPTETACNFCDRYSGVLLCSKTRSTFEGVFCYGSEYKLLNPRELDFVFGSGTSEEVEKIAKKHAQKRDLSSLVERLLKELE